MIENHLLPRIHVLAKPTGAICNLACTYCFFLDKELLYPGSRFRMSDKVLENYIRQLVKAHCSPEVIGKEGYFKDFLESQCISGNFYLT